MKKYSFFLPHLLILLRNPCQNIQRDKQFFLIYTIQLDYQRNKTKHVVKIHWRLVATHIHTHASPFSTKAMHLKKMFNFARKIKLISKRENIEIIIFFKVLFIKYFSLLKFSLALLLFEKKMKEKRV